MSLRKGLLAMIASALLAVGLTAPTPAKAIVTTDFAFSFASIGAPGDFGFGTLNTVLQAPSVYSIIGISGIFDGQAITGLSTYAGADNLIHFAGQPYVSFPGFSFHTFSLGDINVFASNFNPLTNTGYFEVKQSIDPVGYGTSGTPVTLALTQLSPVPAVPEPSTWAMMILGFAGVGFMAYRKRKSAGGLKLRLA